MVRSEIKQAAKNNLRGRWTKPVLYTLLYMISVYIVELVLAFIPVIGPIAAIVIMVPMVYIFVISFMKMKRKEDVGYLDFIVKIPDNFVPSWKIVGGVLMKMLPYVIAVAVVAILIGIVEASFIVSHSAFLGILIVLLWIAYVVVLIPTVMKGLYYAFTQYSMFEGGNNLSGKEATEKSENLMKGHRAEYFVLMLSFIGWVILAAIPFGIGFLWLIPYIQTTLVIFYENLAGTPKEVQGEVVEEKTE
ncbi:MAG: DUF975 family protein [Firmicutes bacterium]|nr:DUF975 family protein [Bacillota bacterium]